MNTQIIIGCCLIFTPILVHSTMIGGLPGLLSASIALILSSMFAMGVWIIIREITKGKP